MYPKHKHSRMPPDSPVRYFYIFFLQVLVIGGGVTNPVGTFHETMQASHRPPYSPHERRVPHACPCSLSTAHWASTRCSSRECCRSMASNESAWQPIRKVVSALLPSFLPTPCTRAILLRS